MGQEVGFVSEAMRHVIALNGLSGGMIKIMAATTGGLFCLAVGEVTLLAFSKEALMAVGYGLSHPLYDIVLKVSIGIAETGITLTIMNYIHSSWLARQVRENPTARLEHGSIIDVRSDGPNSWS